MRSIGLVAFLALAVPGMPAAALVTVAPSESRTSGFEKYVVRVPTEGKVPTAEVELRIPQRFADGTRTEWTGPASDKHPASVTTLVADAPPPHLH